MDNANVVDWFSYFYSDLEYANEAIFTDVPAYSGYQVDITISATSGNAEVSEIGIGKLVGVADSQDGTSLGIKDYSGVSRDIDGVATITERAYAKKVTFEVAFPTSEGARVKRILSRNRAKPVICFADTGIDGYGTITLGLIQDWDFPLGSGGMTFGSIEVEGMT